MGGGLWAWRDVGGGDGIASSMASTVRSSRRETVTLACRPYIHHFLVSLGACSHGEHGP